MEKKKIIRLLKFAVIALIILIAVLLPLSIYVLISGLSGAISGGEGAGLNLNKDTPNGDWILTYNSNPRNTAFLGEKISFGIGLIDPNGKYITVNSTAMDIAPGEQKPLVLTLTVPFTEVQRYNLNGTQATGVIFELKFGISTLGNLVGFSQILKIEAGNSTQ